MKKAISLFVAACLLGSLGGCAPQTEPQEGRDEPPAVSASVSYAAEGASARPADAVPGSKPPAAVFLPSSLAASLGKELAGLAQKQGWELQVLSAPAGSGYAEKLAAALKTEKTIGLYWVEGESEARALDAQGIACVDLSGESVSAPLRALAGLTPKAHRILDEKRVYGLPLGFYGEGTLVNLDTVTALLGSKDPLAVRADLVSCTAQEWERLVEALSAYLQKPQRVTVQLGEHNYTMQRYRPEEARGLRSIFALPAGEPAAMVSVPLAAAVAARYSGAAELPAATPEQRAEDLEIPLQALLGWLDTGTAHMSGKEGPAARGEELQPQDLPGARAAQSLFVEGSALFLPGDTRLGLALEKENPALKGQLALLPVKLPLPAGYADGKTSSRILAGAGGTLCVHRNSSGRAQAQALLLELFSTYEGQDFVRQQLRLLPFTDAYPEAPLLAQLSDAMASGAARPLPAGRRVLDTAAGTFGEWVQRELLYNAEWEQEKQEQAIVAARKALEYPLTGPATEEEEPAGP